MGTLQGPVICRPVIRSRHAIVRTPLANGPLIKNGLSRSGFWGSKGICRIKVRAEAIFPQPSDRRGGIVHCSFSSSSDGSGSMAGNFSESDEDYVNSSVVEAVEVKSSSDGFMIKMRDGRYLRCVHNNPEGGRLPDYAPQPAIVLKMEDGSNLLLPIIVLEMPSVLLMAAVRNVQIARPTIYQVVKDMIDKMGYQVQLVRVTKRLHEAYFSQLYLSKVGDEKECISLDIRPSDAINIAVRCKVPIQVNRQLAYNDGMRVVDPPKSALPASLPEALLFTELDRPDGKSCLETKEFDLVRNMLVAAVEERYKDAARWRDKLVLLRAKRRNLA